MSRRVLVTLPDEMAARLKERRGYLSDQEYILQLINRDLMDADRERIPPPPPPRPPVEMLSFD